MSEREALFEPVRQLFGLVWNRGRLELIDQLVTAGIVLHAGRNAVHGRDNLKTIIADFLIGFPDVRHNIEDLVIEGDRVVTRWRGLGHHRGIYAGIAPTGREIDYSGITIFRIADGRIDEAWVNAEMPELLASLREA